MLAVVSLLVLGAFCQECNKNPECQECRVDGSTVYCKTQCGECLRCWPPKHTVSGISSGGSMAVLHSVVYSATCEGTGVVAGSPYGCNVLPDDKLNCGTPKQGFNWKKAGETMQAYLVKRGEESHIDPITYLAEEKFWLFSGSKDTVVYTPVMEACSAQYTANGATPATVFSIPSEHAWVVNNSRGVACSHLGPPYLNDCHYDMSGTMLNHIREKLLPPAQDNSLPNLTTVDVRPYIPQGAEVLMSPCTFVFVPTECRAEPDKCGVHVHYHGCGAIGPAPWGVSMAYAYGSLEAVAEANRLIVVYPQSLNTTSNPSSCWNWWGEGDALFDTQDGAQLATVAGLLGDLENALQHPAPPEELCPAYTP